MADVALSPLTTACRGVALWMSVGLAALAALTAAGLARPAFPNEPAVAALGYAMGAAVGAFGVWKEPRRPAWAWTLVNVALAAIVVALRVPLGLATA